MTVDDQATQTAKPTEKDFLRTFGQILGVGEEQVVAKLIELLGCQTGDLFGACLPAEFLLSVVIPVYNEVQTLEDVIQRVRNVGIPCEIILVDDGSTDGTRDILNRLRESPDMKVILHERNQGKGAAIRTGFMQASGDVVVIQDADLEYDPRDFARLLRPILDDRADVVYGSRFSGHDRPISGFWHQKANQLITVLSNSRTNLPLTDVETCYKMFRRELIQQIAPSLRENGFGVEIEMTQKIARTPGVRFFERPISYAGRSYDQGKKITWRDGLWALWCILRY